MRTTKIVAAATMLAVLTSSCLWRHGAGSAFRVQSVSGAVEVRSAGDTDFRPLSKGERVAPGADLRTGQASTLELARDDGARLQVAPATQLHVVGVTSLSVASGRVLASTPGIPFGVDADGVHVEGGKAIFRVDVTFEVLVGSYGGAVTVSQDGQSLVVGDFRQIDVAGGVFPRQASPLLIDPKDPWDRELLADALDLDRYLRQYGRSFPNEFPARDPSFYLALVPDVPISLIAAQLRATDDPANVLYALLLAKRLGGSPAQQFTALMAEWQAGATWGLIAHERHISEKIFLAMVIAALTPPTAAPSASSGGGAGGASGGGSSSPSARPSTQPSGSPRPTSSPTPSPSPTGSPSPPPCGLLNQLLGGCH